MRDDEEQKLWRGGYWLLSRGRCQARIINSSPRDLTSKLRSPSSTLLAGLASIFLLPFFLGRSYIFQATGALPLGKAKFRRLKNLSSSKSAFECANTSPNHSSPSSAAPTSMDLALGASSVLSMLVMSSSFLSMRAEQPSDMMAEIVKASYWITTLQTFHSCLLTDYASFIQIIKSNLPQRLQSVATTRTNNIFPLALCIIGISAFCLSHMIITIRRGVRPASMGAALLLSLTVAFPANVTMAEYLLLCLPASLSCCELVGLVVQHSISRQLQPGPKSLILEEKEYIVDT